MEPDIKNPDGKNIPFEELQKILKNYEINTLAKNYSAHNSIDRFLEKIHSLILDMSTFDNLIFIAFTNRNICSYGCKEKNCPKKILYINICIYVTRIRIYKFGMDDHIMSTLIELEKETPFEKIAGRLKLCELAISYQILPGDKRCRPII